MSVPAADLLEDAASAINDGTWCQEDLSDGNGKLCAIGHIREARDRLGLSSAVEQDALLQLELTDCRPNLADWNDRHGRTAEQVRTIFLLAAHRLRLEASL